VPPPLQAARARCPTSVSSAPRSGNPHVGQLAPERARRRPHAVADLRERSARDPGSPVGAGTGIDLEMAGHRAADGSPRVVLEQHHRHVVVQRVASHVRADRVVSSPCRVVVASVVDRCFVCGTRVVAIAHLPDLVVSSTMLRRACSRYRAKPLGAVPPRTHPWVLRPSPGPRTLRDGRTARRKLTDVRVARARLGRH
jgi:hypothetical protein